MAEKKTWRIRLRGPLGKALEQFCLSRLAGMDFDRLIAPYRERNGHLCGTDVLLWGEVISCALRALPYLDGAEELEEKVRHSVAQMMALQSEDGALTAFPEKLQLQGLDLPGRRGVLNALVLAAAMPDADERIKECCIRMTDQLMSLVGPGKRPVIYCGAQGGLDSSALLDSIVGVYRLTRYGRFLDFARYIADSGCSQQHNIFSALEKGMAPSLLGNGNAVGLTDCFKALAELGKVDPVWEERSRKLCRLYMERIAAEELFITGTGGGVNDAGTIWCRGAFHQTEKSCRGGSMGSTDVTASCLAFFNSLMTDGGDRCEPCALAERSFYNAFLGAWDPERLCWAQAGHTPLTDCRRPADSGISSLYGEFRGCEALSLLPGMAVSGSDDSVVLNFYEEMEAHLSRRCLLKVTGGYPGSSKVHISLRCRQPFTISMRIPDYCTGVYYLDSLLAWKKNSYLTITRPWEPDEVLTLEFDPKVKTVFPPDDSPFQAFTRGPLVLAVDDRSALTPDIQTLIWRNKLAFVDYASAGKPAGSNFGFKLWFKKMFPKYLFHFFDYD